MTNNIYKLNIKFNNLKDFNIDTQRSIKENLLLTGNLLNITNIYNDKILISNDKRKNTPLSILNINYNQYPFYDIDRYQNNIEYFGNTINLSSNQLVPLIFSNYDLCNNNLILFNNFLNKKYETSSGQYQFDEKIGILKKKTIQSIKKYVDKNVNNDNIDIAKYITFYNIDYILRTYILNKNSQNKIKLYKYNDKTETSSSLTEFLISNYEFIMPGTNKNDNYSIDTANKIITLKIKIKLKKQLITNQLVIKLLLKGDYNSSKDIENNKLLYNKEYKNLLLKENEKNEKNKKSDAEIKENIENELSKTYDNNTKIKYFEFIPSDISNNYKKYNDIYLNTEYIITQNILDNYIDNKKITDVPKIFFDISDNTSFKEYLNKSFNEQTILKNKNKFINPNILLNKLTIDDSIISPETDNKGKLSTKNILYNKIIENINRSGEKNINNYLNSISKNMFTIINNLIKKKININGKEYHIIKKIFNLSKNNNIIFSFHRSFDNVNYEQHNVYQTVLELYTLDSKKNNNIINRQKLICGINKNNLIDTFNRSDLSGNILLKHFFNPKKTAKLGGNNRKKNHKKLYNNSIKNSKQFNKNYNITIKNSKKFNKKLKKYKRTLKK